MTHLYHAKTRACSGCGIIDSISHLETIIAEAEEMPQEGGNEATIIEQAEGDAGRWHGHPGRIRGRQARR